MPKRTSDNTYRKNRAAILEGDPLCWICGRPGADTADHVVPHFQGGDDSQDNLRPAHAQCNSKRGAIDKSRAAAARQQRRNATNMEISLDSSRPLPPNPSFCLSPGEQKGHETGVPVGQGRVEPRLRTPMPPLVHTFGPDVARWAEENLGETLMPWQRLVLDQQLATSGAPDFTFIHSIAFAGSGRQNGKSFMLRSLIGWALCELPKIWGRQVRIVSTAHELGLATELFTGMQDILELWDETGFAKVTWAYGRNQVRMLDPALHKSSWKIQAASGKKHGATVDILIADELWNLPPEYVFDAALPSQIAVPSPLAFFTSTAGDQSSVAMIQLREQALSIIDSGQPGEISWLEWSVPPDVADPYDPAQWSWSNPALGTTITLKNLQAAAQKSGDRTAFLRAHCNQFVSSASAWLPPGVFASLEVERGRIEGGVLVVDSAVDESKFTAIRVGKSGAKIVASVAFTTESLHSLWPLIEAEQAKDKAVQVWITPSLEMVAPDQVRRKASVWGYAELSKATGVVRGLLTEPDSPLGHFGEQLLTEHMNRAVMVRTQGNLFALSSQKSPGPIEAARCAVVGYALVARPAPVRKVAIGSAN